MVSEHEEVDVWSLWLLHRRHGEDPLLAPVVRREVIKQADRAIEGARLAPDMTIVDIGAGDGLVSFRAIERFGRALRVILSDISAPMLKHAQAQACARGIAGQCTFFLSSAENLRIIADASVDAVITRASLAYVSDKSAALAEFHRILKKGGRLSLVEPVLQDDSFLAIALRKKLETTPAQERDPAMVWRHKWMAAQYPDTPEAMAANPLVNFSERDVLQLVQAAGFRDIHMQVHFDIESNSIRSWDTFTRISPHPWAPSLKSIMDESFSDEERRRFEAVARPQVEAGSAPTIGRALYLQATKPA